MQSATEARTLLAAHRTALETMLSMNAAAPVTPRARRILDSLDEQARTYLARIARHEKNPTQGFRWSTLGTFGPNGCGPAIADICRSAEFHRCRGAVAQLRAA